MYDFKSLDTVHLSVKLLLLCSNIHGKIFYGKICKKIHFEVPEQILHNMHACIYIYVHGCYTVFHISVQNVP